MNAFEPIRNAARKLHAEAIAAGADASQAKSLVEAALQHLKLELAWLRLGDPALKGALAVFDEQSGTICCADIDDKVARVTLVSHEIGHAVVHSVSSQCSSK